MKLISLKIKGFKNLDFWENPIDFTKSEGISIFVGNNGSGKSNVLEAISAIFYGLYDETNERRCAFSYELDYIKDGKNIKIIQQYTKGGISIGLEGNSFGNMMGDDTEMRLVGYYIDGVFTKNFDRNLLPSQIIALYSGEETRLYEEYYKNIDKNFYNKRNMTFIDKNYWQIALFIMFISVVNFDKNDELYKGLCKILGNGINIDKVEFSLNKLSGKMLLFNGQSKDFVEVIKKINNKSIIEINNIKYNIPLLSNYGDFYKGITHYFLGNENVKYINDINLYLNNGIESKSLSEGQKKQILIYFAINFLADKDSIVLLDEPDSYIHVGNKQRLKEFFEDFLDITKQGEFILTTHSPTLMNKFDKKHLFFLENGKLDLKEKREILDKITDGQMRLNEMEIFLNSGNKYLLVTEGITDKKHLEIAIDKLGIKNNFDIYSADSCEKLTNFLITLPNDIFANKTIIGIYDYDQAGLSALKKLGEITEENKKYKVSGKGNRFGISLPYADNNFENHPIFTIEFMYSKEILKANKMIEYRTVDDINRCIKTQDNKLNLAEIKSKDELCFYKVSGSENSKNTFADSVRELESSEFENFRPLFDLIRSF